MLRKSLVASFAYLSFCSAALAQMTEQDYNKFPAEVRNEVGAIRARCIKENPDFKPYALDQGLIVVDLSGTGTKDIILDSEAVCSEAIAGANCSNRGCDMKIWRQVNKSTWSRIFNEHLHRKFISLGKRNRFQMMAVSIFAGDPRCKPAANADYTSGESCDLLVYFRDSKWLWQKVE